MSYSSSNFIYRCRRPFWKVFPTWNNMQGEAHFLTAGKETKEETASNNLHSSTRPISICLPQLQKRLPESRVWLYSHSKCCNPSSALTDRCLLVHSDRYFLPDRISYFIFIRTFIKTSEQVKLSICLYSPVSSIKVVPIVSPTSTPTTASRNM